MLYDPYAPTADNIALAEAQLREIRARLAYFKRCLAQAPAKPQNRKKRRARVKHIMLATAVIAALAVSALAVKHESPLPPGSPVYIEPLANDSFNLYLASAILTKHTPVRVVTDESQAQYRIETAVKHGKEPSTAEKWLVGKMREDEDASVNVIRIRDGALVWGYSVHKYGSLHGMQSTAEAVAKHLKWAINGTDGLYDEEPNYNKSNPGDNQ